MTFFRGGGVNGDDAHEELAAKIAEAGRYVYLFIVFLLIIIIFFRREWAKTYWRKQDMTAYMFRYGPLIFCLGGSGD